MLRRFAETPPEELMRAPNLLSLLYCWKQGSGNDDAKHWAEALTQTDTGLLSLLSRLRGWSSSSSHGVQYPLRRRDLEHFFDYDAVLQRVRQKSEDMDADPEVRALAAELLIAIQQGEERL
jgi:hypothetical protein